MYIRENLFEEGDKHFYFKVNKRKLRPENEIVFMRQVQNVVNLLSVKHGFTKGFKIEMRTGVDGEDFINNKKTLTISAYQELKTK